MRTPPPDTAVPSYVGLAGLAGFGVGLTVSTWLDVHPAIGLVLLILATASPMWWLESKRFKRKDVFGVIPTPRQLRRSWRLGGLLAAACVWALTLKVLPLADSGVVNGFWEALLYLWPLLLVAVSSYIIIPSNTPPTGLELIGNWWSTTPRRESFPWSVLRDQLVKAFFLPLMLAFAYEWKSQANVLTLIDSLQWYLLPLALIYLIDTTFGAVGYLSTSRRLDSHIRSSNPYWLAWIAALICYPPFFTWLKAIGFNYRDSYQWHDWLGPTGLAAWTWGGAILLLTAVYAWSTVAFGIRFSNLTNRGIITNGPYRFTKHPAYLSKNLSWWLISVPFLSAAGPLQATLHCLILLGMNGIYWIRAITEERHLMADPAYRAYSVWIAEYGLYARTMKVLRPQLQGIQ